jgi:molecular chaperone HscA
MLLATGSALGKDGDLLSPAERQAIDSLMQRLREAVPGDDHHAIEAATKALAEGTEAFAAERMNRSIREALSGRKLDEL